MNQSDLSSITISVPASLQTISKYNRNSSIFLDRGTKEKFTRQINLTVLPIDQNTLHPAYAYSSVVDTTFPNSLDKDVHANNILAMVADIVEIEWGYILEQRYAAVIQSMEKQSPSNKASKSKHNLPYLVDLTEEAVKLLESLKKLLTIKHDFVNSTEVVVHPKARKKKGKTENAPILFDRMVIDGIEKAEVLDFIIRNRINDLKSPVYFFIEMDLENADAVKIASVNKEIARLKPHKALAEILHLLKKHVCHTVLFYLRVEMGWHHKKVTLTEEQGEYIYTILLLFNLISVEELSGHDSPRKKAKYISSFFKSDAHAKKIKFPEIAFSDFELPKTATKIATDTNKKKPTEAKII